MSDSRPKLADGISSSLDSAIENEEKSRSPGNHEQLQQRPSRNPFTRWAMNREGKPFRLRIKIRNQLSFLFAIFTLTAVGVLAGISWQNTYGFITDSASSRLSIIADLKRAQIVQAIDTLETLALSIATRSAPRYILGKYYDGSATESNWSYAVEDTGVALSAQRFYVAATLYNANLTEAVLNITSHPPADLNFLNTSKNESIALLEDESGELQGANWNGHEGFPDALYPRSSNISETPKDKLDLFSREIIESRESLLLGPVRVNETFFLLSFTVPVHQTNGTRKLIGFWTVLLDAQLLVNIVNTTQGMADTGQTILVGPDTSTNVFDPHDKNFTDETKFRYILPPVRTPDLFNTSDTMGHFPAVKWAYRSRAETDAIAELDTTNAQNQKVGVGYSIVGPSNKLADWALVIEMQKSEVYAPITRVQQLLIATVFGVIGGILLFIYPLSHWAVAPITRLRAATERTTKPLDGEKTDGGEIDPELGRRNSSQRGFRIPLKVSERPHLIHDELTDLTHTYNLMTEELTRHYDELEERVFQRTQEIEAQRKVAEEANEAKTIFIANISHELRTPLNGILGMCSVLMGEKDPSKVKHSLRIIEKSGELLLALLTDLLTFSKNQYGNHVILEERNFKMSDVTSQLNAIFRNQALEKHIDLLVHVTPPQFLDNINFYGDSNRLMQILINLIGNALKFTERGSVRVNVIIREEDGRDKDLRRANSESSRHSKLFHHRGSARSNTSLPKSPSRNTSMTSTQFGKGENLVEKLGSVLGKTISSTGTERVAVQDEIVYEKEPLVTSDDGAYVAEFWVEDTGPGIPTHLHERVFEPFTQGDRTLSRKHGGTGLGLSISRQLAALLQGTVALKRSDSSGSQFCLKIPLKVARDLGSARDSVASSFDAGPPENPVAAVLSGTNALVSEKDMDRILPTSTSWNLTQKSKEDMAPTTHADDSEAILVKKQEETATSIKKGQGKLLDLPPNPLLEMEKIRVLVAEDNPVNQEVVSRMLRLESIYDIVIAKDGQEAVNRVKEALTDGKHFHIILMDVQMPTLDGIQATSAIRSLGYRAPIVALSAYSTENNIKECYDSGMDYFMSKPVKKSQLRTVLKRYCSTIREEEYTPVSEHDSPLSTSSPAVTPSIEATLLQQSSNNTASTAATTPLIS